MKLYSAIQDGFERLEKLVMPSNEDQRLEELEQQRKNNMDRFHTQTDDAEREITALNESIRYLEETLKSKSEALEATKNQLITTSSELEAIQEETKKNTEKYKNLLSRKLEARSEFSVKDVATLEDTKMKLHVCCALSGVHFNSSDKLVSSGYVANAATSQVKLFDISNLPRKEATKKLWETIEKTTALKLV